MNRIDSDCAVKIVNGAFASIANLDYHVLKNEGFEKCPNLADGASVLATLTFDFDSLNYDEMVQNLNTLSQVAKKLKPAWKQCKPLKKALSRDEHAKVLQLLTIFADPSKYDIYKVAKNALSNWTEVKSKAEKGLTELNGGNCARCGFIFGKGFR